MVCYFLINLHVKLTGTLWFESSAVRAWRSGLLGLVCDHLVSKVFSYLLSLVYFCATYFEQFIFLETKLNLATLSYKFSTSLISRDYVVSCQPIV